MQKVPKIYFFSTVGLWVLFLSLFLFAFFSFLPDLFLIYTGQAIPLVGVVMFILGIFVRRKYSNREIDKKRVKLAVYLNLLFVIGFIFTILSGSFF